MDSQPAVPLKKIGLRPLVRLVWLYQMHIYRWIEGETDHKNYIIWARFLIYLTLSSLGAIFRKLKQAKVAMFTYDFHPWKKTAQDFQIFPPHFWLSAQDQTHLAFRQSGARRFDPEIQLKHDHPILHQMTHPLLQPNLPDLASKIWLTLRKDLEVEVVLLVRCLAKARLSWWFRRRRRSQPCRRGRGPSAS